MDLGRFLVPFLDLTGASKQHPEWRRARALLLVLRVGMVMATLLQLLQQLQQLCLAFCRQLVGCRKALGLLGEAVVMSMVVRRRLLGVVLRNTAAQVYGPRWHDSDEVRKQESRSRCSQISSKAVHPTLASSSHVGDHVAFNPSRCQILGFRTGFYPP
eukprot:1323185-Prymnesium_polylepis.1